MRCSSSYFKFRRKKKQVLAQSKITEIKVEPRITSMFPTSQSLLNRLILVPHYPLPY